MNMIQLKYFVAVCDWGSISRAAQELYISKQGLSRSIQSLEEELHLPLLTRTLSGIQLTPAGQTTYQYAQEILERYGALLHALEGEQAAPGQVLRVAFPNGFFACVPVDLLFSFFARNPGLTCQQYSFKDMDLRAGFVEKHLDLALCTGPQDDPAFDYTPLFRNRRCLYVRGDHPFARGGPITVDQLRGELIGVPGEGYFDSPFLLEQCRKAGFEPRLFLCDGLDLLLQFAQTGRGVSLIVDNLDPDSLPAGLSPVYFADQETFSYEVFILTHKNDRNPLVGRFIQHAQAYCRQLQALRR